MRIKKPRANLKLTKTHDQCASGYPLLTVVMIHGIAANSMSYHNALKYLEGTTSLKDIRFVCFDLLGAGESEQSDALDYNYREQVEALHNAILELALDTPLVLVGHSMGTLIVTRYADTYKREVRQLILLSPPIYTEQDLAAPYMREGLEAFTEAISMRDHRIVESKAYQNSMKNIVLDRNNYKKLASVKVPTVLIYGDNDAIIGAQNIPRLLSENPRITAIKVPGGHNISREKYSQMLSLLQGLLSEARSVK